MCFSPKSCPLCVMEVVIISTTATITNKAVKQQNFPPPKALFLVRSDHSTTRPNFLNFWFVNEKAYSKFLPLMVYCYNNSNSSVGSGQYNMLGQFSHGLEGFNGVMRGGSMVHQALVLDTEKGELVKAPARVGKKEVSEAKVLAALKSHSEAEKRRRERINAHLATLRGLVPSIPLLYMFFFFLKRIKMDKATLLAEVINQVKELKKNAIESSKGLVVPMDGDELKVESYNDGAVDGTLCFKAYLCCNYRPELLSDIRQTIDTLQLKMVSTEVSTLQNRLKTVFIFTTSRNRTAAVNDAEAAQLLTDSIQQALNSVVERGSASPEYSPRTTLPNKRRRVTFFDSSGSSS